MIRALMYKFITTFRYILYLSFLDLINIVFILGSQIIKPVEILQEFLLRSQIGYRCHRPLRIRPDLQSLQFILFHPNAQITTLGLVHTHHGSVIFQRIKDRFRITGNINLTDTLAIEIGFQIGSLQLVERDGIYLLYRKGELTDMRKVDGAVVEIDQDGIAIELILLVPNNRFGTESRVLKSIESQTPCRSVRKKRTP